MDMEIKTIPEILAPAGSIESLKAAVAAGCDAVYVGGSSFGARAYADNFDTGQMTEAVGYCHLHGVKIYLTVNTLLGNREINEKLYDFLLPFYESGLDAVIVQDMGVLCKVREWFPDISIHASTQMAVMSGKVGKWLSDFGVARIVPARELSVGELCQMRKDTELEIEVFVHGALCYSYSGQCLFSSFQGGRSGNRGMCAAPCRMQYALNDNGSSDSRYFFSTKELCSLPMIGSLIDAGIDSFKIEGRMKKPEYVSFVTSVYRKYRDLYLKYGDDFENDWLSSHFHEWNEDLRCLAEIYNRNGFTCGYLAGKSMASCGKSLSPHADMPYAKRLSPHADMPEVSETYNGVQGVKAAGCGGMLSMLRPKHGGVRVGKVLKVDKQTVSYRLERDIHTHDVVEFRDFVQRPSYEYTIGKKNNTDDGTGKNISVRGNHANGRKTCGGTDARSDDMNADVNDGTNADVNNDFGVYKKAGQIVTAKYKRGSRINVSDGVYRTRDAFLIEKIRENYIKREKKICVNGVFSAAEGERARLTLRYAECGSAGVVGALAGRGSRVSDNIKCEDTAYSAAHELEKESRVCGNIKCEVTVFGDACERAKSHPATVEQVKKSITQTGGSGYEFVKLEVSLQGELFLPVGSLKKLRRHAFEELERAMLEPYWKRAADRQGFLKKNADLPCGYGDTDITSIIAKVCALDNTGNQGVMTGVCLEEAKVGQNHLSDRESELGVIVSVMDMEQFEAVVSCGGVSKIYLHMEQISYAELAICLEKCHNSGREAYLILPRILRGDACAECGKGNPGIDGKDDIDRDACVGGNPGIDGKDDIYGFAWDGFVVRNMESFLFLIHDCNVQRKKIVTDSNLYIMNEFAYGFWRRQGVREFMLPLELVAGKIAGDELAHMAGLPGAQVTVYTHIPLMVSAQCTLFNTGGCQSNNKKANGRLFLTDGKGRQFFVVNSCKYCYNTVYQCEAANYIPHIQEFKQMGVSAIRFDFIFEKPDEVQKILEEIWTRGKRLKS